MFLNMFTFKSIFFGKRIQNKYAEICFPSLKDRKISKSVGDIRQKSLYCPPTLRNLDYFVFMRKQASKPVDFLPQKTPSHSAHNSRH